MSIADNCYYELEALKESVSKFIKAYDFGMNKLSGWSDSAYESFSPIVEPYVKELRKLTGVEIEEDFE